MQEPVHQYNPEVEFEHSERGEIAQTVASPGYRHITRIMRSEVDKFLLALLNVPEDDERAIIAKHRLSKAAAQVVQGITNRVNAEVQEFTAAVRAIGPPIDVTEGLVDLGPAASTLADLETDNEMLLGGAEL